MLSQMEHFFSANDSFFLKSDADHVLDNVDEYLKVIKSKREPPQFPEDESRNSDEETGASKEVSDQLVVFARFLSALSRKKATSNFRKKKAKPKHTTKKTEEISPISKLGLKAALPLFFLMLKRQLASPATAALGSEVLDQALTILQELPNQCLYENGEPAPLTAETLEKTDGFLKSLLSNQAISDSDKQKALEILIHLKILRASASELVRFTTYCLSQLPETMAVSLSLAAHVDKTLEAYVSEQLEKLCKVPHFAENKLSGGEQPLLTIKSIRDQIATLSLSSSKETSLPLKQLLLLMFAHFELLAFFHLPGAVSGPGASSAPSSPTVVFSCGGNSYGEAIGLAREGDQINMSAENEPFSSFHPTQMALGANLTLILTEEGRVAVCGKGDYGRLGTGNSINQPSPTLIEFVPAVKICMITTSRGSYGSSAAIDENGVLWTWGDGDYGKLGHGDTNQQPRPRIVEELRSKHIKHVSCGYKHTAAVTEEGEVYTWGNGDYGRLGHGDNSQHHSPKLVQAFLDKAIGKIVCGSNHTLALSEDGLTVYSWGDGDFGKLGHGSTSSENLPKELFSLSGVHIIQIHAGEETSFALTSAGQVYSWGKGEHFSLGLENSNHQTRPQAVAALDAEKVVQIAAGACHTLALTFQNSVFAWGKNDSGQCGLPMCAAISTPTLVDSMSCRNIQQIDAGSNHSAFWTHPRQISQTGYFVVGVCHKPFFVSLDSTFFASMKAILSKYGPHDVVPVAPFPILSEQEDFVVSLVNILSTNMYHLAATATDEAEVGLDKLVGFYRDFLLNLVNSESQKINLAVKELFANAWMILLPRDSDRRRMLFSMVSASLSSSSSSSSPPPSFSSSSSSSSSSLSSSPQQSGATQQFFTQILTKSLENNPNISIFPLKISPEKTLIPIDSSASVSLILDFDAINNDAYFSLWLAEDNDSLLILNFDPQKVTAIPQVGPDSKNSTIISFPEPLTRFFRLHLLFVDSETVRLSVTSTTLEDGQIISKLIRLQKAHQINNLVIFGAGPFLSRLASHVISEQVTTDDLDAEDSNADKRKSRIDKESDSSFHSHIKFFETMVSAINERARNNFLQQSDSGATCSDDGLLKHLQTIVIRILSILSLPTSTENDGSPPSVLVHQHSASQNLGGPVAFSRLFPHILEIIIEQSLSFLEFVCSQHGGAYQQQGFRSSAICSSSVKILRPVLLALIDVSLGWRLNSSLLPQNPSIGQEEQILRKVQPCIQLLGPEDSLSPEKKLLQSISSLAAYLLGVKSKIKLPSESDSGAFLRLQGPSGPPLIPDIKVVTRVLQAIAPLAVQRGWIPSAPEDTAADSSVHFLKGELGRLFTVYFQLFSHLFDKSSMVVEFHEKLSELERPLLPIDTDLEALVPATLLDLFGLSVLAAFIAPSTDILLREKTSELQGCLCLVREYESELGQKEHLILPFEPIYKDLPLVVAKIHTTQNGPRALDLLQKLAFSQFEIKAFIKTEMNFESNPSKLVDRAIALCSILHLDVPDEVQARIISAIFAHSSGSSESHSALSSTKESGKRLISFELEEQLVLIGKILLHKLQKCLTSEMPNKNLVLELTHALSHSLIKPQIDVKQAQEILIPIVCNDDDDDKACLQRLQLRAVTSNLRSLLFSIFEYCLEKGREIPSVSQGLLDLLSSNQSSSSSLVVKYLAEKLASSLLLVKSIDSERWLAAIFDVLQSTRSVTKVFFLLSLVQVILKNISEPKVSVLLDLLSLVEQKLSGEQAAEFDRIVKGSGFSLSSFSVEDNVLISADRFSFEHRKTSEEEPGRATIDHIFAAQDGIYEIDFSIVMLNKAVLYFCVTPTVFGKDGTRLLASLDTSYYYSSKGKAAAPKSPAVIGLPTLKSGDVITMRLNTNSSGQLEFLSKDNVVIHSFSLAEKKGAESDTLSPDTLWQVSVLVVGPQLASKTVVSRFQHDRTGSTIQPLYGSAINSLEHIASDTLCRISELHASLVQEVIHNLLETKRFKLLKGVLRGIPSRFYVGAAVVHPTFGIGVVSNMIGFNSAVVDVQSAFGNHSIVLPFEELQMPSKNIKKLHIKGEREQLVELLSTEEYSSWLAGQNGDMTTQFVASIYPPSLASSNIQPVLEKARETTQFEDLCSAADLSEAQRLFSNRFVVHQPPSELSEGEDPPSKSLQEKSAYLFESRFVVADLQADECPEEVELYNKLEQLSFASLPADRENVKPSHLATITCCSQLTKIQWDALARAIDEGKTTFIARDALQHLFESDELAHLACEGPLLQLKDLAFLANLYFLRNIKQSAAPLSLMKKLVPLLQSNLPLLSSKGGLASTFALLAKSILNFSNLFMRYGNLRFQELLLSGLSSFGSVFIVRSLLEPPFDAALQAGAEEAALSPKSADADADADADTTLRRSVASLKDALACLILSQHSSQNLSTNVVGLQVCLETLTELYRLHEYSRISSGKFEMLLFKKLSAIVSSELLLMSNTNPKPQLTNALVNLAVSMSIETPESEKNLLMVAKYNLALNCVRALRDHSQSFPADFRKEVQEEIASANVPESDLMSDPFDNSIWGVEHDRQIVDWANKYSVGWSGESLVFVCGSNECFQQTETVGCKSPARAADFAALKPLQALSGSCFTAVLSEDGSLFTCGKGDYGRLGINSSANTNQLTRISAFNSVTIARVSISKGSFGHGLAIDSNGHIWSWGDGDFGKLGHGDTLQQAVPKMIDSLSDTAIVCISAGYKHSACVTQTGQVYTWGCGESGRLGLGASTSQETSPRQVDFQGMKIKQVVASATHSLALAEDGYLLYTWGDGDNGKLGHDEISSKNEPTPVESLIGLSIVAIDAGDEFSLALQADGSILSWGSGNVSGHGEASGDITIPMIIDSIQHIKFCQIAAGSHHTLALTPSGGVYCWGNNSSGQLGLGDAENHSSPQQIESLSGFKIRQISGGMSNSIFSTSAPIGSRKNLIPDRIPAGYPLLKEATYPASARRLFVLNSLSSLVADLMPFFVDHRFSLAENALDLFFVKDYLLQSQKLAGLRKVIQSTARKFTPIVSVLDDELKAAEEQLSVIDPKYLRNSDGINCVYDSSDSSDDTSQFLLFAFSALTDEPVVDPKSEQKAIILPDLHRLDYILVGRLLGILIRQRVFLEVPLSDSFWKRLFSSSVKLPSTSGSSDLEELSEINLPAANFFRHVLSIDSDEELERMGQLAEPLKRSKTDGSEMVYLRRDTMDLYLELYKQKYTHSLSEDNICAIRQGFLDVIPTPSLFDLLDWTDAKALTEDCEPPLPESFDFVGFDKHGDLKKWIVSSFENLPSIYSMQLAEQLTGEKDQYGMVSVRLAESVAGSSPDDQPIMIDVDQATLFFPNYSSNSILELRLKEMIIP